MTRGMANEQVNLRLLVLEMLLEVMENRNGSGTYSHVAVRDVLKKYNYLSQQEKSFLKRLFEGTLERMITLDFVINQYSKVKTGKMKPQIRAILRLSVYQILYMDAVPDAAACNEAVKLAQKKGFATLKSFVNGVLRSVARNKDAIAYPDLSVKYSTPEWIVNLWTSQLGEEKTIAVLEGLLAEHPVTVRLRDKSVKEALQEALAARGGSMKGHPYLENAYKIEKTDDMTTLPLYQNGAFVVQDVSSMLAVRAVLSEDFLAEKRTAGEKLCIVDVCAAPGGKSMLAADLLSDAGVDRIGFQIEARDISGKKVMQTAENFARCGFDKDSVSAVVCDALECDEQQTADIVIADVPCSGLGVIGKKRDIKYKITQEQLTELVSLQRRILEKAVKMLKPGGRLLFSTCTINRAENEETFAWLVEMLKMTPVPFFDALPSCLRQENVQTAETAKQGYLQLLPKIHDTDGFFISVLKKQDGV